MSDNEPETTKPAEPVEPHVPSVAEHNARMHKTRPGDCVGRPA